MLVVDASFAIEASLVVNGFERLRGRDAIAPALMWSETHSVLHEMQWRKAISSELAKEARARLRRAPILTRRPARLLEQAWQIADRLGWAKTYDAEYVALAQISKCPLLTVDARLARGVERWIEVVGPADL